MEMYQKLTIWAGMLLLALFVVTATVMAGPIVNAAQAIAIEVMTGVRIGGAVIVVVLLIVALTSGSGARSLMALLAEIPILILMFKADAFANWLVTL
ncbi:MAG: hypothetical protein NVS1B11_37020 [Terriglobales bacterium]